MSENDRSGSSHVRAGTDVRASSHMPRNSIFYEKVVPILLVVLGIVMVALVLFAAGVLLGVVKF